MPHIQDKATVTYTNIKNLFKLFPFIGIATFIAFLISLNIRYGLILAGGIVFLVLLVKRKWLLYAIIFILFLEGYFFSFYFFGARIRSIQVLEVIGIFCLLLWLLIDKIRLKKTPIDLWLWSYIGINFIAIVNAIWFARSIKIAVLLLSLGMLYYLLYNLITTTRVFDKAFRLLLYVGLGEIIYGLYQVFAGIFNYYLGLNLPIGHLGTVHREFIGSPWGRPYGTFVEPDWYGAICMFYALLFICLYYSKLKEKKKFYFIGMILSIIGLFFSFVRAAWVGFVIASVVLLFFKYKSSALKLNLALYIRNIFIFCMVLFLSVFLYSPLRNILRERFYPVYSGARFSLENVRVQQMKTSFKAFLRHPLIGNGPGSAAFNYLVEDYGEKYAKNIVKDTVSLKGKEGFDPSIITTVMEDTGIIGLILLLTLIGKIVFYNLKIIPLIDNKYSIIALGLFSGLVGLFISYNFSTGFWISFTWVFLAFNMVALRIGTLDGFKNSSTNL